MNALLAKTLKRCFPEAAGAMPVAAVPDFLALAALADDLTQDTFTERLSAAQALDLPVEVGGVRLWRLSMAACEWLATAEREWFSDDPKMMDMAVVWAHAHARDMAAFTACGSSAFLTAYRVRFWALRQGASWQALTAAIKALLPIQKHPSVTGANDAGDVTEGGGDNFGPILANLISTYGQTAEYWLWQVPQDTVAALLEVGARRAELMNGELVQPTKRQLAAQRAFGTAALAFEAKWGVKSVKA